MTPAGRRGLGDTVGVAVEEHVLLGDVEGGGVSVDDSVEGGDIEDVKLAVGEVDGDGVGLDVREEEAPGEWVELVEGVSEDVPEDVGLDDGKRNAILRPATLRPLLRPRMV